MLKLLMNSHTIEQPKSYPYSKEDEVGNRVPET